MINHVWAIFWKLLKDTLKNKTILIQFVMFPFMTVIMENAISIEGLPEHYFANLFAVMYVGMAPLTCAAAIISEEKEKNTLRVLQMCNVKAFEFLLGNAIYIVSVCMIGSLVIGLAGGYRGSELVCFSMLMLLGHIISCVLGAAVGVISKNQMSATSITVPAMLVLSFIPMLSMFNETIQKVGKFVFSEQLYLLINNLEEVHIEPETGIILGCNVLVIAVVFLGAYRRAFGSGK